eukprot:15309213-Alexandrium_andersonii.AAC.1
MSARRTCMRTSTRTCASHSLRRFPSRERAPSSGAAFTSLVPPRPVGRRSTRRPLRVSGSPEAKPAHVAFTTPSWT